MSPRSGLLREPLAIALRAARPPLVLALDVGTSGLRAFLFDARARPIGTCIAHDARAVRTSADGEATLDAEERARAAIGVIDRVLDRAGKRASEIAAVATSTFWHSLVGIDANRRPTTRVLTWADTRARGAASALRNELDEDAVHARTGCRLHASYLPAKLRYLREAEPEAYRRTAIWLSFGEYLYLRLFGERRAGHGMASATGLYDQRARDWDDAMLARLQIARERLSPIDDAPQTRLRPAFARRWPALARVPWLPAIGDGACSNVGAGAVGREVAALFLGTSGALRVVYRGDDPPVVRGGWTYRLDRERFVAGGALSNGGNVLSWLRTLFPRVDLEAVLRRADLPQEMVALPLLAGDRSPSWDDGARAAIVGMGLGTAPEDIARAMIEGVALRVARLWALVDEALPRIRTIVATGGALLASTALLQLFADATGRPLVTSAAGEGSARGAAILALERLGVLDDIADAPAPRGRAFRPRAEAHRRLRAAMARQERLEVALGRLRSS